ncbi:Probable chlorophyll(ide) b reductase NYC1, chloroplastic [Linum grandiflorum]
MTVKELEENLKEGMASAAGSSKQHLGHSRVVGIACDVCDPSDVKKLADFAVKEFGSINLWINNAGTNKGFRPLLQFSDEDITQIVSTNLVGSILCTREAMRVMENQPKGGHIFNMDGAGSGGSSTPLTAVYGATKCGLRQLQTSLLKESKKSKVGVHTASPGMVLTELLLSGSTLKNKQMFNIICELPETVARTLVPRMRVVKGSGKAINYLTPPRILLALVTAWLRRGRWFDDKGRALYAAEADRLRNWAENRARFSFTDAMEMYTENTWVSVFSLSVVCAFIILSSTASGASPGT